MPKGVTLSPDGERLYVTNFGQANGKNIIDVRRDDARAARRHRRARHRRRERLSRDGSLIYASNFPRNSVQFIDTKTRRVTREIQIGLHPKILVLSKDGKTLFAANWTGNSVTRSISRAATSCARSRRACTRAAWRSRPRGSLYVANFNGASIDVFHGADFAENYTLAVCPIPRHLVLSPDEKTMFLSCYHDSQLWALDLTGLPSASNAHRAGRQARRRASTSRATGNTCILQTTAETNSVSIVDTGDWTAQRRTPCPAWTAAAASPSSGRAPRCGNGVVRQPRLHRRDPGLGRAPRGNPRKDWADAARPLHDDGTPAKLTDGIA